MRASLKRYGKIRCRNNKSHGEVMHPEMLNYLLENNMLQYGDISSMAPSDIGNEIFTHYIDFIARNHRRHYYHDHDY